MTVRIKDTDVVALEGDCTIEDAEPLVQLLLAHPDAVVDWRECDWAHTAVVQVLLAARPRLRGPARGPFLGQFLEPALLRAGLAED